MKIAKPFTSIPRAFLIILGSRDILRLALWPWIVGALCYLLTGLSAIYLYTPLLYNLMHTPQNWWQAIIYFLLKIGLVILLFSTSLLLSITLVLILTSVFQTAIVEKTLSSLGRAYPGQNSGAKAIAKESLRTILVESIKLIWLLPLMLLCLIMGLIPLLTPFAIILAAWLLAFQFIDVVLDLYRLPIRKRFGFCRRHFFTVLGFGLSLTLLWAIPLLGILIPPVAAAAAGLMLHELGLIDEIV